MTSSETSQRLARALNALVAASGNRASANSASLVVADSVARYWMLQPPEAVSSLAELQAVAAARCEQIFGAGQEWQVAGDWDARRPFLCASIPGWIAEGARDVLGAGSTVRAALPMALGRLVAHGDTNAWICITSPGRIALLSVVSDRLGSVRALAVEESAPLRAQLEVAAQELRRESLRLQVSLRESVQWWHVGEDSTEPMSLHVDELKFIAHPIPHPAERSITRWSDAHAAAVMAALF